MAEVLYVDDDQCLTDLVRYALERERLTVRTAHSGREAMRMVRADTPDLMVLDVDMPDVNGFDVLSCLRTISKAPAVILTGGGQEEEALRGFGHGADDYVAKPFSIQVLIARIKAILRRTLPQCGVSLPKGRSYGLCGAVFYPDVQEIVGPDVYIKLTPSESRLLYLLLVHEGQVLATDRIREQVCGDDGKSQLNVVKTHVHHLRTKLSRLSGSPQPIQAVPDVGYVLRSWQSAPDHPTLTASWAAGPTLRAEAPVEDRSAHHAAGEQARVRPLEQPCKPVQAALSAP
jgi:DNA-binding response OmpR family regulator